MAEGWQHARVSVALAGPGLIVVSVIGNNVVAGIGAGLGCLAGVILSPDLDQKVITISERKVLRRFGCLGWLWVAYFYPYAKMFRHRVKWTHWPVLSTAIRVIYQFWWLALVLLFVDHIEFQPWMGQVALGLFLGLCMSDLAHWLMDGCP